MQEAKAEEARAQQQLAADQQAQASASRTAEDQAALTQAQQDVATRRLAAIKPLLTPGRTRQQVEAVAQAHQVSMATVYRWISRHEASGSLSPRIDPSTGNIWVPEP